MEGKETYEGDEMPFKIDEKDLGGVNALLGPSLVGRRKHAYISH